MLDDFKLLLGTVDVKVSVGQLAKQLSVAESAQQLAVLDFKLLGVVDVKISVGYECQEDRERTQKRGRGQSKEDRKRRKQRGAQHFCSLQLSLPSLWRHENMLLLLSRCTKVLLAHLWSY